MARDLVLEVVEQVRGNALGEAARDLDQLAGKTDTAAGAARDYTADLKTLEARIEASRAKIRALGVEFVATQDKMLGRDLRSERGILRQLERIRADLADATDVGVDAQLGRVAQAAAQAGGRAGGAFASGFLRNIGHLPSQTRGVLLVGVVGGLAALSPVIGAAVSGAVIGAVGAGGIAGGIAAASRDPRVRTAAAEFSATIAEEFFSGGQAFVQPTVAALHILQDAFSDLDLGDSWARVAPYVTEIAEGIAGMGREFMPGFNRALDKAGPALGILADRLPQIGDALGDMLTDISESKGALEGWAYTLQLVEDTIRVTGTVLGWLGDRFHEAVRFAAWFSGVLEDIPLPWMDQNMAGLNDKFEEILAASGRATEGLRQHGSGVRDLVGRYMELSQTFEDYLGFALGVDQANLRVAENLLRLKQTLRENGKDWREATEAGQANRQALLNMVAALIEQREATIRAGGSAHDATAQFEAQLNTLQELAVKAGISRDALRDLVGDYHVRIVADVVGTGRPGGQFFAGLDGFAAGGFPPVGEPFWVGEAGAELMALTPRPRVFSHQESQAMASASAQTSRQVAQALAEIKGILRELKTGQPPPVVNIYAPETMSPRELSAVVARELAWNS